MTKADIPTLSDLHADAVMLHAAICGLSILVDAADNVLGSRNVVQTRAASGLTAGMEDAIRRARELIDAIEAMEMGRWPQPVTDTA